MDFIQNALRVIPSDERLIGLAAGGSLLSQMDEFSDLDLVFAVEPSAYHEVMAHRSVIANGLGRLLSGFTGEHVGEPRLLICLYDGPLHVDLKFVSLDDVEVRVEDPRVLWDRDGRFAAALSRGRGSWPQPDLQWIEDRFWVWIHYATTKAGRGELFETMDFLAFLRGNVLGPLAAKIAGHRPTGVRRLESVAPHWLPAFQATVARHDRESCFDAIFAAADLYRKLQNELAPGNLQRRIEAERTALAYLKRLSTHTGG